MSNYVANWVYRTTFEGDALNVTLRPLSRLAALRFASMGTGEGLDEERMALYENVVRESVVTLNGLRDANGLEVTLDCVLRDAYFTKLVLDIGTELVRKAGPADPD